MGNLEKYNKIKATLEKLEKDLFSNVTPIGEVMTDDKVDISLLKAISYDPFTHGYYEVGQRVGNAFHDGLELK